MGKPITEYFSALGGAVAHAWTGPTRRPEGLADAAVVALTALRPGPDVGAKAVLEHAATGRELPAHQSGPSDIFGQPPLILHDGDGFFIQALTWIDGTTDIHQHGFSGAFGVAEGLSLHVPYRFDLAATAGDGHLVAGELVMGTPEILRPGDVRRIDAGYGFIHALFHLERPTVTIVVRNETSGLPFPQYSYLRPGLGYDRLWSDRRVTKQLQALRSLQRIDPPAADAALVEVAHTGPEWVAFLALHETALRTGWTEQMGDLGAALAPRLGPVGELVAPAVQGQVQQGNILARRGLLTERHHRTFLALLANLPDRDAVEAVLRALYPGQSPSRLVLEWIAELSSSPYRGISGLRLTDAQLARVEDRLQHREDAGGDDLASALSDVAEGWEAPVLLQGLLAG
jgi:hypothetical protein